VIFKSLSGDYYLLRVDMTAEIIFCSVVDYKLWHQTLVVNFAVFLQLTQ